MIVRNLTKQAYYLSLGANTSTPDIQFPESDNISQLVVVPLSTETFIPPDRIIYTRQELEDLLRANKLQVVQEDPYDPFVYRDTTLIRGFPDSGFRLIPRWYDYSTYPRVQDDGTFVSPALLPFPSFETWNFINAQITESAPDVVDIKFSSSGIENRVVVTAGTYSVQPADGTIALQAVAPITIELPAPSVGFELQIKDEFGNADNIPATVDPGIALIDGEPQWIINAAYANLQLYADGSAWRIR